MTRGVPRSQSDTVLSLPATILILLSMLQALQGQNSSHRLQQGVPFRSACQILQDPVCSVSITCLEPTLPHTTGCQWDARLWAMVTSLSK